MLFVEHWVLLSWYKQPSAVSNDFGKHFVILFFVSDGHVVRLLFSAALNSVDVFGIPNDLCRYVITYSMVPSGIFFLYNSFLEF